MAKMRDCLSQNQYTAEESQKLAASLGIEIRFLPRATPELNAMDH